MGASAVEVDPETDEAKAEYSCANDDVDGTGREGNRGGKAAESSRSLNPDLVTELEADTAEGGGELPRLVPLIVASPVVNARGRWKSSEPRRRCDEGSGGDDDDEVDVDGDVKFDGSSDAERGATTSCSSCRTCCCFWLSSCRSGFCSTGSAVKGPSVNDAGPSKGATGG